MHDLGLKTSVQTFNAFVRCTLMGNQPWPQFQNEIQKKVNCTLYIIKFLVRFDTLFLTDPYGFLERGCQFMR